MLSLTGFNPLTCADDAPSGPPRTAGGVMDLRTRRQLREIRGLGPRRIGEIEAALGRLDLTGDQQHPANQEGPAI